MEEGGIQMKEEAPEISEELKKIKTVKIVEEIECFTPRRVVAIKYTGPNIRKVVKAAGDIIQRGMHIGGTRTYLDRYHIDVTDPNNIRFTIYWHGDKGLDKRNKIRCILGYDDGVIHPDGSGYVKIKISPRLLTTWDKSSILKRNPIYDLLMKIYGYVYYDELRRKYVLQCKELGQEMVRIVKEMLKLMETAKLPYP